MSISSVPHRRGIIFVALLLFLNVSFLPARHVSGNISPTYALSNSPGHLVYLPLVSDSSDFSLAGSPKETPTAMLTQTMTQTGQPTPVGQSGNWHFVFNDEFNNNSLNTSVWHTCFWWAGKTCSITSNNELELYNQGDVLVQNGTLRLRAQKRDMTGWDGRVYHYTSGMVMTGGQSGVTKPGFTYTFGYAEARIKIPSGQGLWPAFWMLPVSYAWPPEIDAMEILGHEPSVIHMTYHFAGGQQGNSWTGPDFSAGWHVIGLDWEPNAITWYVDGIQRAQYTNTSTIPSGPMYLLLNLAVGGSWPGSPDSNTPFPSFFDVDYVRVWQK